MNKLHIRFLAKKYNLEESVIEAIIKSPYEFIRVNSKNFISVRIPKLGLFIAKENRRKHLDERASEKRNKET